MLLLADIGQRTTKRGRRSASHHRAACQCPRRRGLSSRSATRPPKNFWRRSRPHPPPLLPTTNAFKINEDVVIPLPRLADYSDGIERINIELSIQTKLKLLDALEEFIAGDLPLLRDVRSAAPTPFCSAHARKPRWHLLRDSRERLAVAAGKPGRTLRRLRFRTGGAQSRTRNHFPCRTAGSHPCAYSWKRKCSPNCTASLPGASNQPTLDRCDSIHPKY